MAEGLPAVDWRLAQIHKQSALLSLSETAALSVVADQIEFVLPA